MGILSCILLYNITGGMNNFSYNEYAAIYSLVWLLPRFVEGLVEIEFCITCSNVFTMNEAMDPKSFFFILVEWTVNVEVKCLLRIACRKFILNCHHSCTQCTVGILEYKSSISLFVFQFMLYQSQVFHFMLSSITTSHPFFFFSIK